jgi:hypothetical protein
MYVLDMLLAQKIVKSADSVWLQSNLFPLQIIMMMFGLREDYRVFGMSNWGHCASFSQSQLSHGSTSCLRL